MDVADKIVKNVWPGSEKEGPIEEMVERDSNHAKDPDTARRVVKNIIK